MTQEELGQVLGVQKSAIAKYENDHVVNLKRETIEKMADYFGVKPSYILGMETYEATDIIGMVARGEVPDYVSLLEKFSKLTRDQQEMLLLMMDTLIAKNQTK